MKNRLITLIVVIVSISSCATIPNYLPIAKNIGSHPFGSFTNIKTVSNDLVSGELISVDSSEIIILTKVYNQLKVVKINIKEVKNVKFFYAKGTNYGWTIPLFSLMSITQGFFSILTLPFNLITTIAVTVNGNQMYSYQNMTVKQLKMFARFPQGLPSNFDLTLIK